MTSGEDDFDTFLNLAQRVGNKISEVVDQGILCDALVLKECFVSANESITFHGKGDSANHYKRAGHYCFWIAKLKPLDFTVGVSEFISKLVEKQAMPMRKLRKDAMPGKKHEIAFPINEFFALHMGHTMAIEGLDELYKKHKAAGEIDIADKLKQDIDSGISRFEKVSARVVKSLRINNYTARATATMFEWAYFGGQE